MTDVLIIGDGPAGLAAAIMLRQSGCGVAVASRNDAARHRVGETLAASALRSLHRLGVRQQFLADGHLRCFGNSSSWGAPSLHYYPFLLSPDGYTWHLDRAVFEQRLRMRAEEVGVQFVAALRTATLQQTESDGWRYSSGVVHLHARVVVDASGRNSAVARQCGIPRIRDDNQIALVSTAITEGAPPSDRSSVVEAVENGWWYTAPLPDGSMTCLFFTDPDLHDTRLLGTPDGWLEALLRTVHTRERMVSHRYMLAEPPVFVAANSSYLARPYGTTWIAAGDAAMSYDPLSSHGIGIALASGIDAAAAVQRKLDGETTAFAAYGTQLRAAYDHYSRERLKYYSMETRWPGAPYWVRRRTHHAAVPT